MDTMLAIVLTLTLTSITLCGVGASVCTNLATYNVGLLTQIPHYIDREPRIPQALMEQDSDVYCLQEYWTESDIAGMLRVTEEKYPYHYSPIHAGVGQLRVPPANAFQRFLRGFYMDSACSRAEYYFGYKFLVGSCVAFTGCLPHFQLSLQHGLFCTVARCGHLLKSPTLNPDCVQCLVMFSTGLGQGDNECRADIKTKENRINPTGLVLLSKRPLTNVQYSSYHNHVTTFRRGYIQADVEGVGKVVCTHLTSIAPVSVEYNQVYANYTEQQAVEIQKLIDDFGDQDHIAMGDFNAGPEIASTGVEPEHEGNYHIIMDSGYQNPYVDKPGECTFCVNNTLVAPIHQNSAIDFVLVKGDHLQLGEVKRVFDEVVEGDNLSDHYGVELQVCTP